MLTLAALVVALLFLPTPWNVVLVVSAAVIDLLETGLFLWWSQRRRSAVGVDTLVGRPATVLTALAPRGQVRVAGEIWQAESPQPVDPGVAVVVRAVHGLTLEVEPALRSDPSGESAPGERHEHL